ncbi:MAG: polyprenyl synthetase family protein [Friedmanniella sp.]|nr:polyprenyl synthetase family protein [Friedmanniella sp.]
MVIDEVLGTDAGQHQPPLDPGDPLSPGFRDLVSARLSTFLDTQQPALAAIGDELEPVLRLARDLLRGGKRLRPAFCVWGSVAAAGLPGPEQPALVAAAASLDLLHVSALVHDDVMDGSDVRRGQPSAHRQLEAAHVDAGWVGDPAAYGRAGAILLGDLLLMWSAELLQHAGLPAAALARGLPVVEAMRTEVTGGQFLDIVAQAVPLAPPGAGDSPAAAALDHALQQANRVVEFKSARYTVQRPAQLGAALGGGDPALHEALGAYGSPLGRAFQFRDDVLGVFGDPELTGKPSGDDLREGKRTVLVAHAYAHAGPAGRALVAARLGDPALDAAGVADLQQVITESGALAAVEATIEAGYAEAMSALDAAEVTPEGRTGLTAMAEAAVLRSF